MSACALAERVPVLCSACAHGAGTSTTAAALRCPAIAKARPAEHPQHCCSHVLLALLTTAAKSDARRQDLQAPARIT